MKYTRKELSGKALTALGPIFADELGITICHEHCFHNAPKSFPEPREATAKRMANEPLSIKNVGYLRYGHLNRHDLELLDENETLNELRPYRQAGGRTIVDATNIDQGRDPLAIRRVALATGLNIIMGSGYYVKSGQDLSLMDKRTEANIAEELVRDIFEGVGATGIHSGLIGEIGCSWPLEEAEKKVLRAAGMAQRETGAPLHVHPGRNEDAPFGIIEVLKEVNTDLTQTCIDHIDRTLLQPKNRHKLAGYGCFLEFDLWGLEGYYPEWLVAIDVPNDAQRIAIIKDLIAHGYGKQILLAHDIDQRCRYMTYGGHGYTHILNNGVPAMRRRTMTEEQINDLLIGNPKRFLTFR